MSDIVFSDDLTNLLIIFLLSFAAGSVLPLGSEWFVIVLLEKNISALWVVALATLGNTLGGYLTWWLGKAGRAWYDSKRVLSRRGRAAEALFKRYGVWSLLLSWVPIVGDILVVLAGISRTPTALSLILIFIGKLLRYVFLALAWLGVMAG